MLEARLAEGMERGVLLLRHSAREYRRDIHDLENPLTEESSTAKSHALLPGEHLVWQVFAGARGGARHSTAQGGSGTSKRST